jgi:hypothetical protein
MLSALILLAAAFAAPQQPAPAPPPQSQASVPASADSVRADTTKRKKKGISIAIQIGGDSARAHMDEDRERVRRPVKRIPVTPALMASAFADEQARSLVLRARAAQYHVDSSLRAYDAKAYQRFSMGLGLRIAGRERLFMRAEQSQHILWDRDRGALVHVTGARWGMPMIGHIDDDDPELEAGEMLALPYIPGRDRLWPIGTFEARVQRNNGEVDENNIVHPMGAGAEAYYKYSIGDSVAFRLPSGKEFRLIELRVRPRVEHWNTVVGSLWFDRESWQLVRAAYRLSAPMDIWMVARENRDSTDNPDPQSDIPFWLKPALNPMRATISGITQEFSLQEQQWWLPISQQAEGLVEVGKVRIPIEIEERFTYASVTSTPAPASVDSVLVTYHVDSLTRDSLETIKKTLGDSAYNLARKSRDSVRTAERKRCNTERGTRTTTRDEGGAKILVVIPCDSAALARSPDMPATLYASTEELFGPTDRDELMAEALALKAQAEGGGSKTMFYTGIGGGLLRYNRVEGLAVAARAEKSLGSGYSATALARLATADLHPSGELTLSRTDGRRIVGVGAYHRLDVAGDFGEPFGLGASLGALLFGHDDGLYYRSTGIELTRSMADGRGIQWRLFGEHQGNAPLQTQASLPRLFGHGASFDPNITAQRADIGGLGARLTRTFGLDPHGWRLYSDMKAEIAGGSYDFARGLLDETISHGLGPRLDGALTGAGGWTGGSVPAQRLFYVGGSRSVRGQPPGSNVGNAFWLARAELGSSFVGARPVIFYDLGWAGSRDAWQHPGRPLSGAGVGVSFLDGLFRFDVAKGIHPKQGGVRVDTYIEARF